MTLFTNQIICGECAAVMAEWPADCIDLTITSPPYGNLRSYEGFTFDFPAIAAQLWRVTKPGGVVVWVVGDATVDGSETGTSFRQALHFMDLGFRLHDTMIFEKQGFMFPSVVRYHQVFEYMFVLSRGVPRVFHPLMDRKNKYKRISTKMARQRNGKQKEMTRKNNTQAEYGRRYNIWRYIVGGAATSDKFVFQHPAIFPESLARDHIRSWSNPGDVVLDPMCGSGTVAKICIETGRQYIGIDMSEKYCEIARRRVAGAQPPLFLEDSGGER